LHEALGSSVLDAMNFGLPIVATAVGGIPEFVVDGTNGILVAPEASEQLMGAISLIVDNPELADQMHLANRARAAEFGADRMADAYEDIYRQLL
jgi:glycosyltransferase involved in cell wall biosynthesis